MKDASGLAPTERFSGLANLYAQARPDYPEDAIDYIIKKGSLNTSSRLADIGCGTGISTRRFALRNIQVIGIEPNDDMRREAEETHLPQPGVAPQYLKGTAEATGLAAGSVDAIISAQAFHWFAPVAALAEFHRILKPNCWAILMWNERNSQDSVTQGFGVLMRSLRETAAIENKRTKAGEAILQSNLFTGSEKISFPNQQVLSEELLVARALSTSYSPRDAEARYQYAETIRAFFKEHEQNGSVTLRYETILFLGRKA